MISNDDITRYIFLPRLFLYAYKDKQREYYRITYLERKKTIDDIIHSSYLYLDQIKRSEIYPKISSNFDKVMPVHNNIQFYILYLNSKINFL